MVKRSIGSLLLVLIAVFCRADGNFLKKQASKKAKIDSIEFLISRGDAFLEHEDSTQSALVYLKEAYFLSERADYISGITRSANLLGSCYVQVAEFAKATSKFYTAMRYAQSVNDSINVSKAYRGLGIVNYSMANWNNALSHFKKAKKYSQSHKNPSEQSVVDYLTGLCYYNLEYYDVALTYLDKADSIAKSSKDNGRLLEIRLYKNHITVAQGKIEGVIDEYDSLIQRFEETDEPIGVCYALKGKAKAHATQGNYDKALSPILKSLELARSIQLEYPMLPILESVVKVHYELGMYKESSEYLMELQSLKESMISNQTSTDVALIRADFEFLEREADYTAQIDEKNQERQLLMLVLFGLFIIILVTFFAFRSVARERKRSDMLLNNILPEETAKELKVNGVATAKAHSEVSIVFADIQNFTTIASTLEPRVLVKMLDSYFSAFDEIVQQYGIEKIKTIGDAYMFVSGLDSSTKDNASRAVSASLDMIQKVNDINEEMQEKYGKVFSFRFGMHTGKTVSGVVGKIKYAFDIWGDSVNIAARMEQSSVAGKLNVSESTYSLIKNDFKCIPRGDLEVKNKGSMHMYFVDSKPIQKEL